MRDIILDSLGKPSLISTIQKLSQVKEELENRIKILSNERRFTAAVAVLQGLVTGQQTMPVLDEDIAVAQAIQACYAVMQADALLKELEK